VKTLKELAAELDTACEAVADGMDVTLAWYPLVAIREVAAELRKADGASQELETSRQAVERFQRSLADATRQLRLDLAHARPISIIPAVPPGPS
jgi:hypothetical protein